MIIFQIISTNRAPILLLRQPLNKYYYFLFCCRKVVIRREKRVHEIGGEELWFSCITLTLLNWIGS